MKAGEGMSVISQVLVLFLLMLCGLLAVKARWINDAGLQGLNKLVIYFSSPFLILSKLQQDASPSLLPELIDVFWMGGLAIVLCGLIGLLIFQREKEDRKKIFIGMAMFSNAGFMGFPVLISAFGEEKLIYGIIYVAIFNVLLWSVGVLIFDKHALSLKKIVTVPTLLASVLGVILFLCNIRLPAMVNQTLELLGDTTTPVAMFVVGARLSQLRKEDITDMKLLLACALRLIVLPLIIYFLTGLLGATEMVRTTVTLCTAMPCAAVQVIHAETYHGNAPLASRGVALSTALSIATIPVLLTFLI